MDLFGRKARRERRDAARESLRRSDELRREQPERTLTDSSMTTNLGMFDSGVVLDGGSRYEHAHNSDPSPEPPSFTHDSSGSDGGGGGFDS